MMPFVRRHLCFVRFAVWLVLLLGVVKTLMWNYNKEGTPFKWRFSKLIGKDGLVLALSDGVLVGITFLCVPFVRVIST
jgi:sterol O-acyltransferase